MIDPAILQHNDAPGELFAPDPVEDPPPPPDIAPASPDIAPEPSDAVLPALPPMSIPVAAKVNVPVSEVDDSTHPSESSSRQPVVDAVADPSAPASTQPSSAAEIGALPSQPAAAVQQRTTLGRNMGPISAERFEAERSREPKQSRNSLIRQHVASDQKNQAIAFVYREVRTAIFPLLAHR